MHKQALTALKGSIEHWKKMIEGEESTIANVDNCDECLRLATKELEFLKSLLSKEECSENEAI